MRLGSTIVLALMLSSGGLAQTLGLKPAAPQRISVEPGPGGAMVAAGGSVTLWAEVTPKPNIHVYAAGAKDFTPVALSVTPSPDVAPAKPIYPPAELSSTVGLEAPVPVYRKVFRISQPIVIARTAKPGQRMTVAGTLTYQACDDRLCYPTASVPVVWSLVVK